MRTLLSSLKPFLFAAGFTAAFIFIFSKWGFQEALALFMGFAVFLLFEIVELCRNTYENSKFTRDLLENQEKQKQRQAESMCREFDDHLRRQYPDRYPPKDKADVEKKPDQQ